jgi:hypothetical protein
MPTLFRFLMVIALIGGTVAGSLYVLAEYFQPEPKEISKSLRGVKAREGDLPPPIAAVPAAPGTPAPSTPAPSPPAPSPPAAPTPPSAAAEPH